MIRSMNVAWWVLNDGRIFIRKRLRCFRRTSVSPMRIFIGGRTVPRAGFVRWAWVKGTAWR